MAKTKLVYDTNTHRLVEVPCDEGAADSTRAAALNNADASDAHTSHTRYWFSDWSASSAAAADAESTLRSYYYSTTPAPAEGGRRCPACPTRPRTRGGRTCGRGTATAA